MVDNTLLNFVNKATHFLITTICFQLIHPGKQPHKSTQTDAEVASMSCDCDVRYAKIFSDFKDRIEDNHKEEKERALKELEERVSVFSVD